MQLLGLYLNDMPKAVSKVLHKGWYPFGAYKRPLASKLVVVDDEMRKAHRVYQQEGLPQISVNSIVGMNGTGKSSLLDIIYRIINNFSVRMLGNRKLETNGRELSYAHGVDADLNYICEGKQYRISCRKNRLYWFVQNEDGNSFEHVSIKMLTTQSLCLEISFIPYLQITAYMLSIRKNTYRTILLRKSEIMPLMVSGWMGYFTRTMAISLLLS